MTRRFVLLLAVVILTVTAVAPALAADRETGLEARIDMAAHVGHGQRALAQFTLRNDSAEDVFILQWQTPLRALEHEIFDVRRDGRPVEYLGPHIKFGPPHCARTGRRNNPETRP